MPKRHYNLTSEDFMKSEIDKLKQDLAKYDRDLERNPLNSRANAMYKYTLAKIQELEKKNDNSK